jgi:hypothetical protein
MWQGDKVSGRWRDFEPRNVGSLEEATRGKKTNSFLEPPARNFTLGLGVQLSGRAVA